MAISMNTFIMWTYWAHPLSIPGHRAPRECKWIWETSRGT